MVRGASWWGNGWVALWVWKRGTRGAGERGDGAELGGKAGKRGALGAMNEERGTRSDESVRSGGTLNRERGAGNDERARRE